MSLPLTVDGHRLKRFPRPRGDEPQGAITRARPLTVFPARAGMSRIASWLVTLSRCFPRPRGDEPTDATTPAVTPEFSPPARG